MQEKNITSGFTLVEILVVIVVLGVIALGVSNFSFSRLSQKQKVSIETIQIGSIIEEVRNNALLGRAVGISSQTPLAWRVQISRLGSGQISTAYTLNGSTWTAGNRSWSAVTPLSLSNIRCTKLDGTGTGTMTSTGTGTILFTGSLISFSGPNCMNEYFKILEIEHGTSTFKETLRFQTLSGIMENF